MKLTWEIIHSAGRSGCGFNWHQLRVLQLPYPPPKGWLTRLIDTEVSDKEWDLLMALRGPLPKRARNDILRRRGISPSAFATTKLHRVGELLKAL